MSAVVTPPRYFWRRVAAFIIDYMLATIVAALIMLPLVLTNPVGVQMDGSGVSGTRCFKATKVPQELHDLVAPERINEAEICRVSPLFVMPSYYEASLTYSREQTVGRVVKHETYKVLTVSVDQGGLPISPLKPQGVIVALVMIVGSAWFLKTRNGRTPGKSLMKLWVNGAGCDICREFWRFSPVALLSLTEMLGSMVTVETVADLLKENFSALIWFSSILSLLIFAYYLVPLLRWRGAMIYDRITGFRVEMKSKNGITP